MGKGDKIYGIGRKLVFGWGACNGVEWHKC